MKKYVSVKLIYEKRRLQAFQNGSLGMVIEKIDLKM